MIIGGTRLACKTNNLSQAIGLSTILWLEKSGRRPRTENQSKLLLNTEIALEQDGIV